MGKARLEGKRAIVTGAGSGIGRATSLALAERGCSIAVVDVQRDGAEETADLIRSLGTRASVHVADVRDPKRMGELPSEVEGSLGSCQLLVNPAGVTAAGAFAAETVEDLRWIAANFPERYQLKDKDGILSPDAIADNYWMLHNQPRSAWTHELDLRPWMEPW